MASQHVLFLNELEGKKACWQQDKVLQFGDRLFSRSIVVACVKCMWEAEAMSVLRSAAQGQLRAKCGVLSMTLNHIQPMMEAAVISHPLRQLCKTSNLA